MLTRNLLAGCPLTFLDVGCSGGIDPVFFEADDQVRVLGVDPNIREVQHLSDSQSRTGLNYMAAFVGPPSDHPFRKTRVGRDWWGNNPWDRLSTAEVSKSLEAAASDDAELTALNAWGMVDLVEADNVLSVDEIVRLRRWGYLNLLKIDVDGADLAVLNSAQDALDDDRLLAVVIEVNFHGTADETDNTFHNVDRMLRAQGFELFNLSTRRYSARALPARFVFDFPAQTETGRILQGDAVYVRDMASPSMLERFSAMRPCEQLKLACLFDVFGLPDCAAELVLLAESRIDELTDPIDLLDLLTRSSTGRDQTYQEYISLCREDPDSLMPREDGLA